MANSVIKKPLKGYRVVAETGSTNETLSHKLQRLQSAFNSLSTEEKLSSVLLYGPTGNVYRPRNIASSEYGGSITNDVNHNYITFDSVRITDATFISYKFTTSGLNISDLTNENRTTNIQLCIVL